MICPRFTAPTRQSGRLIAREHREPRPAYSLSVLYFAGRPTGAEDLCSPRYCGPPLTIKIEATENVTAVASVSLWLRELDNGTTGRAGRVSSHSEGWLRGYPPKADSMNVCYGWGADVRISVRNLNRSGCSGVELLKSEDRLCKCAVSSGERY